MIYTDDFLSRYSPGGAHGALRELREAIRFPGMAILCFMVMFGVLSAFGQQPQQPPPPMPAVEFNVEVTGTTLADFTTRMDAYAALRRSLEEGIPALAVTDNASDIYRAERLLADRIRRARAGAGRGDIFTGPIRRGFRELLRPVANSATCAAIRDDNPGEFSYAVNADYPKRKPVSTVPASILAVLPRLPPDIWYRFLDRDLILHDTRANVILDRIDDAIRCGD